MLGEETIAGNDEVPAGKAVQRDHVVDCDRTDRSVGRNDVKHDGQQVSPD